MVDGGYTGFCLVGGLAYFPNRKSTRTGESIYIYSEYVLFVGDPLSKSKYSNLFIMQQYSRDK